jgi:hypothetical protein
VVDAAILFFLLCRAQLQLVFSIDNSSTRTHTHKKKNLHKVEQSSYDEVHHINCMRVEQKGAADHAWKREREWQYLTMKGKHTNESS